MMVVLVFGNFEVRQPTMFGGVRDLGGGTLVPSTSHLVMT